jgi:sugar phosphate isomerase/epimerase
VDTVSSPMTLTTAKRLVPFAERHRMRVAIHNQADGAAGGPIATSSLRDALALSPAFALKLDVGNLTASNRDAIAELRADQSRVAFVVAKDRLRNGGASQVFGEGDTPLAAVVGVLKSSSPLIPAMVEYDYVGLRPAVDEVNASMRYLTRLAK